MNNIKCENYMKGEKERKEELFVTKIKGKFPFMSTT